MEDRANNISRIALNLTSKEFLGYCKGMSLHWFFKSIKNHKAYKRVEFWDGAFDKHHHNCSDYQGK